MPHHLEDGYKVGTQASHVMSGSQSGSLCTGSDTSRFKSGDSDNEGRNLVECASDEACEQENSKFGLPNDSAIYPGAGADPASQFRRAISVTVGSQISLRFSTVREI